MSETYDAVIYDLDGTLVRLAVDWGAVRRDVATVLEEGGADPGSADLWTLVEFADEAGLAESVEATIAEYELIGARESTQLSVAAELPRAEPVGVCSLNCAEACRIALETHGLDEHIGAIVGRDSVREMKPDPEPLRAVIEALDARPEKTLFIGDSESDAETAAAAGTEFAYVRDR